MIFHRLEEVKKGKKTEYKIDLVERHFFVEKKLSEVLTGIKNFEDGKVLVDLVNVAFNNGVKAVELKLNQRIKL